MRTIRRHLRQLNTGKATSEGAERREDGDDSVERVTGGPSERKKRHRIPIDRCGVFFVGDGVGRNGVCGLRSGGWAFLGGA